MKGSVLMPCFLTVGLQNKDMDALKGYGGVEGLAKLLNCDLSSGLTQDQVEANKYVHE